MSVRVVQGSRWNFKQLTENFEQVCNDDIFVEVDAQRQVQAATLVLRDNGILLVTGYMNN